jgi:hypothetical protein
MTGVFGYDCNNRHKLEAAAEDAARQTPGYGQGIPVGSTRSALTIAILPWRLWRGRLIPNTHRPEAPGEHLAVYAISIAHEIAWPLLPGISLRPGQSYRGSLLALPAPTAR